MTEKRFRKGYVLGDTGLIDELGEPKWFIENINSVSDLEKNWDKVIDKLNDLAEENKQLKYENFNLNKTVEYLDETVKEQYNKLHWANECGVRWEEEYNKWIG